jgi:hypothetical protein
MGDATQVSWMVALTAMVLAGLALAVRWALAVLRWARENRGEAIDVTVGWALRGWLGDAVDGFSTPAPHGSVDDHWGGDSLHIGDHGGHHGGHDGGDFGGVDGGSH